MAYKVIVQCSEVDEIVRLLKKKHGADYSRVWKIDARTIGVFSFERSGILTQSGYVNLITLDHDKTTETCEITVIGAGGGVPTLVSLAEMSDPGAGPVTDLVKLARTRNWPIHVEQADIKSRGTPCPKCNAAYVYAEDKIGDDGAVECQNCGVRFIIKE
jgi:predicted Zn finger-like uncharacterized protein